MSQFIPLEQAIEMTTLYRQQKENILAEPYKKQDLLAKSETFDRDVFDTLLSKTGCAKIRIYYGMDGDLKVHAIIVPVSDKDEDILPSSGATLMSGGGDIAEDSVRCPPMCPPPSPLDPP